MNFTRTYFLILVVSIALAILSGTIKNFPYLVLIFSLPMFTLPETFEGSRGVIGLYGNPGIMGPKGPLGYPGDTGYFGYKGPDGPQGPTGPFAPWPKFRGPPGIVNPNIPKIGTLDKIIIPNDFVGVFIGIEYQGQNYSLFKLKSSLIAGEPIRIRKYYDQVILDKNLILIDVKYSFTSKNVIGLETVSTLTFDQSRYYSITFRKFLDVGPDDSNTEETLSQYWHNIPNVIRYVKIVLRSIT